jgi:hypothetical protein
MANTYAYDFYNCKVADPCAYSKQLGGCVDHVTLSIYHPDDYTKYYAKTNVTIFTPLGDYFNIKRVMQIFEYNEEYVFATTEDKDSDQDSFFYLDRINNGGRDIGKFYVKKYKFDFKCKFKGSYR